jgi:hypothetical protein
VGQCKLIGHVLIDTLDAINIQGITTMKKKFSVTILASKAMIFLSLIIGTLEPAYAEDTAALQKCSMMSNIVGNIVDDRDSGVSYKSRIAKNNRISAGTQPAMHELLTNMTRVVYKELGDRSKMDITNSTFYACMKTGG